MQNKQTSLLRYSNSEKRLYTRQKPHLKGWISHNDEGKKYVVQLKKQPQKVISNAKRKNGSRLDLTQQNHLTPTPR